MNIRTRLLLLVLAVWVPAMAGFGLLARATYVQEARAAREHLRDAVGAVRSVIDRELDKRAAVARTLAATQALRDDDLRRFYEDAKAATDGSGDTVLLVDAEHQLVNTRLPFGAVLPPRGWRPASALIPAGGAPEASDLRHRAVDGVAVLSVLVPEPAASGASAPAPARYNVGVAFMPAALQSVLDQQKIPPGAVLSVLDRDFQTIARTRDPVRWLGARAASDTVAALRRGGDQPIESRTHEGEPTVGFVTHAERYGWSYAIGLPRSRLDETAIRVTLQAFAAALVLAAIGLVAALLFARQIRRPVLALAEAAAELGRERVPAPLRTRLEEVDRVGAALREAGLRSARATEQLEQRVAEAIRQTEEAQRRLLDGQKHEAIGRLTGGLAHDLNNFLQTMRTGLQVLDLQTTQESGRRVLEASTRALDKAATLVRQMLAFGRTQQLKAQPIDLHDFVLRCEDLMGRAVGSRVRLTAEIAPGLPPLHADPTQLELALLNLVFNARDAMAEGGTVVIRGHLASATQSAGLAPGRYIAVDVVDTGGGMDAEVLQRVFEPYFTTKAVGAGTGLGLPQVRAFAVQSGGAATIRSERGAGTTVSMLLPASDKPVRAGPAPTAAPAEFVPLRVLFVEDDLLVSSVVVPALRAAGHTLRHCLNGDAAIQALQDGGLFDVVFTDVVMPGNTSGIDLARWCLANIPAMAVVVATGYTTQHLDVDVKVLSKPYALDTLLAELQVAVRLKRG